MERHLNAKYTYLSMKDTHDKTVLCSQILRSGFDIQCNVLVICGRLSLHIIKEKAHQNDHNTEGMSTAKC